MVDLSKKELSLGKNPALIVVDMTLGFTSSDSPLGSECDSVKAAILRLLELFRSKTWPIFFTSVEYSDQNQASVFRQKLPALEVLQKGSKWVKLDSSMERQENEPIIVKHWASGFFATDLAEQLIKVDADCLIVTGLSTSGCVRATCLDGLQHNYPVFVAREATGDRNLEAHLANLHDLNMKYAEVKTTDSLIASLKHKV
jgi:maleamate amidohydrolase